VVRGQVGRNNDARLVYRTSDGGATTAIDWTSRMLTEDRDEVWTAVIRDVTDLWERDQALGRMMKALSHKLRTPLTGLSAGLEFAREHQSDPIGAEMVDLAQRSAARLQDTIVRMLEFVDASDRPGPLERRHPAVTPEELVASLSGSGVGEATTTLIRPVRVDTSLAERAVGELAANARAAGAGRVALHIAPHPDRSVQFEVTDDGPGFPAAAENRVFEPFYQRDLSGEQPGAGLGLAILRADLGRAGGSIGAWSAPGQRTTVWFRLPDQSGRNWAESTDVAVTMCRPIDSTQS
jgi:signal transduction histidine kinase